MYVYVEEEDEPFTKEEFIDQYLQEDSGMDAQDLAEEWDEMYAEQKSRPHESPRQATVGLCFAPLQQTFAASDNLTGTVAL